MVWVIARARGGASCVVEDWEQAVVSSAALRQASLGCLRRWQADPDVGRGAMATVMAAEWVQNLAVLEGDLEGPVETVVEAARKPWWR